MTNLTTTQAGVQITRDGYHWGSTLGAVQGPITFGFRTSAPGYSVYGEDVQGTFTAFSAAEQAAARAAMALWASVANITFTDLGNSNSATIEFANYRSTTDQSAAFAFYPVPPASTASSSYMGDIFYNTYYSSTTNLNPGTYEFLTLIHEIGHALGLEHPGDYNAGPGQTITYANSAEYVEDTRMYSVMSYFDESYTGANFSVYNETPMLADIAAIQRLYTANTSTRSGDSVYGFNSNAGSPFAITSASQHVAYTIWDGGGADTLDFSGYSQNQTINMNAESFSSVGGDTYNVSVALGVTIERAYGGSGGDMVFGNGADNTVYGMGGVDVIYGNAGSDTIDGGTGADTMYGGTSDDTFFVDNTGDAIGENSGEGTELVYASVNFTLAANVDNLTLTGAAIIGTGNGDSNTIVGNSADNTLYGLGGVDIIDGGTGADTMYGGAGNDAYYVDNASDQVLENANEGTDTVYSSVLFSLGANVEYLTLQGTADLQGYGNTLVNIIYGNSGNNTLDGGSGADALYGGAGNDSYFVEDPADLAIESASEGADTVYSTAHLRLGADVEVLVMQGSANLQGYGNAAVNVIYGNSGNNILNGDAGADTMYGGTGNDAYFVDNPGDTVIEYASEGIDDVYSSAHLVIGANIEYLHLTGTDNIQGYGNALANILVGNSGNNLLDGRGAADTLYGYAGNDTFFFRVGEASSDVVIDFVGNGAAAGDRLLFADFGVGATFTQTDATHWQIDYNGGASQEVITFANAASIHASDFSWM